MPVDYPAHATAHRARTTRWRRNVAHRRPCPEAGAVARKGERLRADVSAAALLTCTDGRPDTGKMAKVTEWR